MTILLTVMCWSGVAWIEVNCGQIIHNKIIEYKCTEPISFYEINGHNICFVSKAKEELDGM